MLRFNGKIKALVVCILTVAIMAVFGIVHYNDRHYESYIIISADEGIKENQVAMRRGNSGRDTEEKAEAESETTEETQDQTSNNTADSDVYININTNDISELDKLYRIGEKMAQRIIDYRKKHGDFEVIQDIMRVSGIGEKTFEQIKDNIYVE